MNDLFKKRMDFILLIIRAFLKKPFSFKKLFHAYKERGISGVKIALLLLIDENLDGHKSSDKTMIWYDYKNNLSLLLDTLDADYLKQKPLISIVLPTYNTPVHYLEQALQSVISQYYKHWELCIVDDASTVPATKQLLTYYSNKDSRIKVTFSPINQKVSITTNKAINNADGDYVVFMDHDDILEPQALLRIAEVIELKKPDFIYSDEVLISQNGQEILEYYFRPTLSKERLRGHPYIVHLIAFNRRFLQQLGGLDEKLMISQDYDLILRTVENTIKIVHIPEILYQWRQVASSAGFDLYDQVMDTSIDVLQRHLQRCGEKAAVYGHDFFNFFATRYPVPQGVKVGIIIPTKNQCQLLKSCIESIEKTTMDIDFDIIVIDHQSDEQETLEYLKSIRNKHQIISYQGEFNFSKINNTAVKQLSIEYTHLLFCNNDIQAIEHNWLSRMLELFKQKDIAVVGAKLVYADKQSIQHAGVNVGVHRGAEHYGKFLQDEYCGHKELLVQSGSLVSNCEVLAVTAACMLVDKKVFDQLGGFDEELAVGFGDTDLCLKISEAGYRVIFCGHARLVHHESISRGVDNKHPEDSALFIQRWDKYMHNRDPYYNPNLSTESFSWEVQNPLPVYTRIKEIIN